MKKYFNLILAAVLLSANASFAASNFNYTEAAPSYPNVQQPYGYPQQQFGAQTNYQRQYYNQNYNTNTQPVSNTNQTLKGRVVTVPAGQNIPARFFS